MLNEYKSASNIAENHLICQVISCFSALVQLKLRYCSQCSCASVGKL